MATLTVNTIDNDGLNSESVYVSAAAGGDQFANTGREFIVVKNGDAGTPTVTLATPATYGGLAVADVAVTMGATTGEQMIGPFPTGIFNDANGNVQITYTAVTSLTISAFKLP